MRRFLLLMVSTTVSIAGGVPVADALSLDAKVNTADGEGETLVGTLGGWDRRFDLVDARDAVASSIGRLSKRERTVLELRFGAEMTQSQIAERHSGRDRPIDRNEPSRARSPMRLARGSKCLAESNKSLGPGQATKKQNPQ